MALDVVTEGREFDAIVEGGGVELLVVQRNNGDPEFWVISASNELKPRGQSLGRLWRGSHHELIHDRCRVPTYILDKKIDITLLTAKLLQA